jgi:hypothetical protein
MSSFGTHPDEGLMLRYIDGELAPRQAREIESHLAACWQCRAEIEGLQHVVSDCVRYRKNVQAQLPEPPNVWRDIYRDFDRIDLEDASRSWISRLSTPAARRWTMAATAAAVLACVVLYQLRQTPSVEAAALLHRAVAAAGSRQLHQRHIEIRTKHEKIVRTVGDAIGQRAALPRIAAEFQAAHYDFDDPLSAKAYQGWHDSVAAKDDPVTTVADCYRIHTTTSQGELASASILLRERDLEPVQARFEFRDDEWVEMTEITDGSFRDDAPPAVAHLEPPVRPAEPSRPAATLPGESASVSDELRVVAALHGIGADLGDPVEISRSGEKVLVSGIGIAPDRQQQIRDALGGLPNVSVNFQNPDAATATAEPVGAAPASGGGAAPPIQTRIEQQIGGHADFERLSVQLLEKKEALMSRAYALRALAQRFPVTGESSLIEHDRRVLRDMAAEHIAALSREAATIENAFGPVLRSMGGTAAASTTGASSWQNGADELVRDSTRLERLLSESLGASQTHTPADHLPSDLLTAMKQLRADVTEFQSLLASR